MIYRGASSGRTFILSGGGTITRHVSEHTPTKIGSRPSSIVAKEAGSLYKTEVFLKFEVPLIGHYYCCRRSCSYFGFYIVKKIGNVVALMKLITSSSAFEAHCRQKR